MSKHDSRFTAEEVVAILRVTDPTDEQVRKAAVEMLRIVESRRKQCGRPAEDDDELLIQMHLLTLLGRSRRAAAREVTKNLPESRSAADRKRLARKYPAFAEWLKSLPPL